MLRHLLAALITLGSTLLALVGLHSKPPAQPWWVVHYHERVAEFRADNARLDPGATHVVLLGDSLTEAFKPDLVKDFMPTIAPRVLNRGIWSDGVGIGDRGVLNRLNESVFDTHPSHIVFEIGFNDMGPGDPATIDKIIATLREVLLRIRTRLPGVPIVLECAAPVRGDREALNPALRAYSEKEKALAKELGLESIDLEALLAGPDGRLPADMTTDGLHWSPRAYAIVGRAVEEALAASDRKPLSTPLPAAPEPAAHPAPIPSTPVPESAPASVPTSVPASETRGFLGGLSSD